VESPPQRDRLTRRMHGRADRSTPDPSDLTTQPSRSLRQVSTDRVEAGS
jgi:hypothetical protein